MPIGNQSLKAALKYTKLGFGVLPLSSPGLDGQCSCGEPDCEKPAKHPQKIQWRGMGPANEATVMSWWWDWPDANIAVRTGGDFGLLVLDVDPRNGGIASLQKLVETTGPLPDTLTSKTGGDGLHYYFKYPKNLVGNPKNLGPKYPGLDIKADGGYVVAPPSRHINGKSYQWIEGRAPGDIEVADVSDALLKIINESKSSEDETTRSTKMAEDAIPDGERNNTLFSLACALRSKGLNEAEILPTIMTVNEYRCNSPLRGNEVANIVSSACNYKPGSLGKSGSYIPFTDVGNAQRFVAHYGHDFRWCQPWKKFLVWDGTRYRIDETLAIERLAKDTLRTMYAEASRLTDEKKRTKIAKYALHSEHMSRIRAMVDLAKSEPNVPVHPDQLDKDDWLFNCQNGNVDLHTGQIRPHCQKNLITKIAPVNYDPDAKCDLWLGFLRRIMNNNQGLIDFIQKAVGYALTGSTREQCLFILYGTGSNGKSTLINTIATLLGDYAQQTPTQTLMAKKQDGIGNDIARLKGARLVSAAESESGRFLAEATIKQMTGGDKIVGRFLHGEFFEFEPKFKIFLSTNHKPNIRGTDHGIWRRIRLIPFAVTIPEAEKDENLMDKLKAELPGILNWAIEGCLKWQREGLQPPEEVATATLEYRAEMDILAQFLQECCGVDRVSRVGVGELYQAYTEWCERNGKNPLSQRNLSLRMKERGFNTVRSGANGYTEWHGLKVTPIDGLTEVLKQAEPDSAILFQN